MSHPAIGNLRELISRDWMNVIERAVMQDAAELLEAIDAQHQMEPPAPWALSTPFERSYRCTCGRRWPCPTARLLHPDEAS